MIFVSFVAKTSWPLWLSPSLATDDIAAVDDEFTSYGAYLVQIIDRAGTDIYLGIRNHQLDRTGAVAFDDILAFMAGARVKF